MTTNISPTKFLADLDKYISNNGYVVFSDNSYVIQGSLILDYQEYAAEQALLSSVTASSRNTIMLSDTGAALSSMSDSDFANLPKYSVSLLGWTGERPMFSLAQEATLGDEPITAAPQLGTSTTVNAYLTDVSDGSLNVLAATNPYLSDTAANIEQLTPDAIAAMPSFVSSILATDATVQLTVAQADALESASLTIQAALGSSVIVVDTPSNLESMTTEQLAALDYIGVNAVAAEGAHPAVFSAAQITTLGTARVSVVAPPDNLNQAAGTALVANPNGMEIEITWAPSVASAPADFEASVEQDAEQLAAAISSPITVHITVGYGEFANNGGGIAPHFSVGGDSTFAVSYSQLVTALDQSQLTPAQLMAYGALPPASDGALDGNSTFYIGTAEAKALGLVDPRDDATDGVIGMGVGWSGATLLDGVLHEMAHGLGRIDGASGLSLFRYAAAANGSSGSTHDFNNQLNNQGAPSYFSIDGGVTKLADFGVTTDDGDFQNSPQSTLTPNDPFDQSVAGDGLTPLDLVELNVMGFGIESKQDFTVAGIEAFSAHDIDLLNLASVRQLNTSGSDVSLDQTEAANLAQDSIVVTDVGYYVDYQDSASGIQNLSADEIATLLEAGVNRFVATNGPVVLSLAQVEQLAGVAIISTPAGDALACSLTTSEQQNVTNAQIGDLAELGVTEIHTPAMKISASLAAQLMGALPGFTTNGQLNIEDLGANLAAYLTPSFIQDLYNFQIGSVYVDSDLTLSLEQATGLYGKVDLSSAYGAKSRLILYDNGADFASLTPDQIHKLPGAHFSGGVALVSDTSVTLTVQQAAAYAELGGSFVLGYFYENILQPLVFGAVTVSGSASEIEALQSYDLAALATNSWTIGSTSSSIVFNIAQAAALYAPGAGINFVGAGGGAAPTISVDDSPGDILAIGPSQMADLHAFGFTTITTTGPLSLEFADADAFAANGLTITGGPVTVHGQLTQIAALAPAKAAAYASRGYILEVQDYSAAIDALTTTQIGRLVQRGVSRIASYDTGFTFSVRQVEALEAAHISATAPLGMTNTLSAYAYQIETLTAAQILGLTTLEVTVISSRGSISFTVAQALALEGAGVHVNVPTGASCRVTDTAAHIEALTLRGVDDLAGTGVTGIVVSDGGVTLSVLQATALERAGLAVSHGRGYFDTIQDTASQIASLTSAQILKLSTLGVTEIDVTDHGATLDVAQAQDLIRAGISLKAPNGYSNAIADSGAQISTLTVAQINRFPSVDLTRIIDDVGLATLTVAQALALETVGIPIYALGFTTGPGGGGVNTDPISTTGAITTNSPILTNGGPTGIPTSIVSVEIADSGSHLKTLTVAEIQGLDAVGVGEVVCDSGTVILSVDQTAAFAAAHIALVGGSGTLTQSYPNGDYSSFHNGALVSRKTVNPDGSYVIVNNGVSGQAYVSDELVYNSQGAKVAVAQDNGDGSGSLTLFASGLTVSGGSAPLSVISSSDAFTLHGHATETITASGTASDLFAFSSAPSITGSGWTDTIVGFKTNGATHDTLQLSAAAFGAAVAQGQAADIAALLGHTAQNGLVAVITDSLGDVLKLNGVSKNTLAAAANSTDFLFV